jgi:hypothetical protein
MASPIPAQKEERVIFTAGSKSFSVRDVIDAAHFGGGVETHWQSLLANVAAQQQAEEAGIEIDESAIDADAVEFRYRYDLITAEETERWLEARGLTLADFSDYFARAYSGRTLPAKGGDTTRPFHEASRELRELLTVELILNGELDAMASRLSWRVAVADEVELNSVEVGAERKRFAERSGVAAHEVCQWLASLERDEAWFDQALAREAAFRKQRDQLLSPEAAAREIGALRLPLTRFEVETIEFESRDAASEAVWCVRNDGMSMAEVAQEGRYPYQRGELVLEEIQDDLQQKFLSLAPGNLLEPIAREDGFQLSRLIGKAEPKLDDPNVRSRIEQRILERYFTDLAAKCVRWEITAASSE